MNTMNIYRNSAEYTGYRESYGRAVYNDPDHRIRVHAAQDANRLAHRRIQRKLRVRELYLHCAILALICAVAALVLTMFITHINTQAAGTDDLHYYKYFTSVHVTKENTITDIAEQYADDVHYASVDDYLEEVSRMNGMEKVGSDIPDATPGTDIVVPYYSTEFK